MIKQVLSTERMRHLKELGVDASKASMLWIKPQEGVYFVHDPNLSDGEWLLSINVENDRVKALCETVPAFTLQDIIELMPRSIDPITDVGTFYLNMYYYDQSWVVDYLNNEGDGSCYATLSDSIMDAAYDMLCWCIENGYLKGGDE